jgi:AAA15 family ATPase/GTPase
MLIEFRVKNFNSFKDEQVFSLVGDTEPSLSDNYFEIGEYKLLKSAAIYGANASGKTNLVKAFAFFIGLIKTSFSPEPGKKINLTPFLLDEEASNSSSTFEASFLIDNTRYQFGFTLTKERILEEWLYAFPHKRSQEWFNRKYDVSKGCYIWKKGTHLKGEKGEIDSLFAKTIETALFLSVAAQWNNTQLSNIYNWFSERCETLLYEDNISQFTAKLLESNDDVSRHIKEIILSILRNADLGIEDIKVDRRDLSKDVKFALDVPEEVKHNILENLSLTVSFLHRGVNTKKLHKFPMKLESAGTKRLFDLVGPLLDTISNNKVAFIDEIETSLHPLLTVAIFQFLHQNSNGGQIVFTTHDTTLLNTDIFRRDQIWFTEKDGTGASKLYPLTDYKPRKEEAIQKGYLAGRYGAIPILKEFGVNE